MDLNMDFLAGPIIANMAHVIQMAVAPVFLLAGIGALLNVLAHRLGRIIDRARNRESAILDCTEENRASIITEIRILSQRMRFTNWAITLCTIGALLVCLVVGLLFVGSLMKAAFAKTIAALFILAMTSVIVGLISFLGEIYVATKTTQIGLEAVKKAEARHSAHP